MKRFLKSASLIVAAAMGLFSCINEQVSEDATEIFTVGVNTAESKTTNDGVHTLWTAGDVISVLYAVAGTPSTSEFTPVKMTLSSGAGTSSAEFTGNTSALSGSYDFYAIYPYKSGYKIPGDGNSEYTYIGHREGVTQSGYNSTSHLCNDVCPLYGVTKDFNVTSGNPSFEMKNLSSVMKLNITNNFEQPFTLTGVSVQASENIVGGFCIDFSSESPIYSDKEDKVKDTGEVKIENGTEISVGESVQVYLPIKPYIQAEDTPLYVTITATVNGATRTARIEVPTSSDLGKRTFKPGKIKKVPVPVTEFEEEAPKFVKITSNDELTEGDYLIVCERKDKDAVLDGSRVKTGATIGYLCEVVSDNGKIECSDELIEASFHITPNNTNNSATIVSASGLYIYHTGAGNSLNNSDSSKNVDITFDSGNVIIQSNDRKLKYNNSSPRFCFYTSEQTAIQLYKFSGVLPISPTIEVSSESLIWKSTESDAKSVTVTCRQNWEVTNTPAWATVTKVDATSFTVTPKNANTSITPRTATLTVTNTDTEGYSKTVELTQKGASPEVTVSATTLTWKATEAGSKPVTVTCEQGWAHVVDWNGAAEWADIESNGNTLTVTPKNNNDSETERTATITVTNSLNSAYTATVSISQAGNVVGTQKFVKVTSNIELTEGDYLIVYETDKVAFDGSLATLDKGNNEISVSITDNSIAFNSELEASTFHINPSEKTILSKSGSYIYSSNNKNELLISNALKKVGSIGIDGNNDVVITGTNAKPTTLRFNKASGETNYRFRFYKSGQEAIQLYKLTVIND